MSLNTRKSEMGKNYQQVYRNATKVFHGFLIT